MSREQIESEYDNLCEEISKLLSGQATTVVLAALGAILATVLTKCRKERIDDFFIGKMLKSVKEYKDYEK